MYTSTVVRECVGGGGKNNKKGDIQKNRTATAVVYPSPPSMRYIQYNSHTTKTFQTLDENDYQRRCSMDNSVAFTPHSYSQNVHQRASRLRRLRDRHTTNTVHARRTHREGDTRRTSHMEKEANHTKGARTRHPCPCGFRNSNQTTAHSSSVQPGTYRPRGHTIKRFYNPQTLRVPHIYIDRALYYSHF